MGGMAEEFRDMRRARKLRKRGRYRRRCYDWIVVGGDWHYARNRSSFKEGTYKSINATAMGNMVIGVGTVELLLKRSPNERGPPKKYTLTDVLHIPTAPCNGFNPCKRGPRRTAVDMAIRFEESDSGNMSVMQSFNGEDGAPLWFARKFYDWYRVALAGESYGESPLVETGGETRFPFDLSLSSFDVDDIEGQINGLPAKTPLKFTKALFRGGEDTKAEILRQAQAKLREMESWQERTADVLFTEQQDYTIEEPSVASFGERRADVLMIEEQHYMNQEPPVEIRERRPDVPLVEKPQYTHQQPPVEIQEKIPDVRVVERPHYTDQQPPVEINTQVEQPLRPGDVGWW